MFHPKLCVRLPRSLAAMPPAVRKDSAFPLVRLDFEAMPPAFPAEAQPLPNITPLERPSLSARKAAKPQVQVRPFVSRAFSASGIQMEPYLGRCFRLLHFAPLALSKEKSMRLIY